MQNHGLNCKAWKKIYAWVCCIYDHCGHFIRTFIFLYNEWNEHKINLHIWTSTVILCLAFDPWLYSSSTVQNKIMAKYGPGSTLFVVGRAKRVRNSNCSGHKFDLFYFVAAAVHHISTSCIPVERYYAKDFIYYYKNGPTDFKLVEVVGSFMNDRHCI